MSTLTVIYDNYYYSNTLIFRGEKKPYVDPQDGVFVPAQEVKDIFYRSIEIEPNREGFYSMDQLSLFCDNVVWNHASNTVTFYEFLDEKTRSNMDYFTEQMKLTAPVLLHPYAYPKEQFLQLCDLYSTLFVLHYWEFIGRRSVIAPQMLPMVQAMEEIRNSMQPIADIAAGKWEIWGDEMPGQRENGERDWRYAADDSDFRPFLIPYMLEDQNKVKGNIVVISGGAYEWHSNRWEGYEAVHKFNELGYNCFLLQRRVHPYGKKDGARDLQRAIRFLKYNAEKFGIAQIDRIAVNGYSGGGRCILDLLAFCHNDTDASAEYAYYQPDAIDALSSKVQAALLIYGIYTLDEETYAGIENNPELPPIFQTIGQKDPLGTVQGGLDFYQRFTDKVPMELHVFQNALHGFGVGPSTVMDENGAPATKVTTNILVWPELADTFMELHYGLKELFV